METLTDKITLNLDRDSEVSVKGFIAPIERDMRWCGHKLRLPNLNVETAVFF